MEISSYQDLENIEADSTVTLQDNIYIPNDFQVTSLYNFTGTFNGKNYIIKNLQNPLFLYIDTNAVVKNITLHTPRYTTDLDIDSKVFGFISCETKGTIKNITVKNAIIDVENSLKTGIISGSVNGLNNTGLIQNCTVSGNISSSNVCGGIIGRGHHATLSNVHFSGKIKTEHGGGVAGELTHCSVTKSTSKGRVKGNYTGGFVGSANESDIQNCGTTTNIDPNKTGGGFAGTLHNSNVQKSYTTGKIHANNAKVSGFSFKCTKTKLSNIYWDFESSELSEKYKNKYSVSMNQNEIKALLSTTN